jgi:lambda family phage portal protein
MRKKKSANNSDIRQRASKKNLKARADGGLGGGGSGIFSQFEAAKFSNKRQWVWSPWPADMKKTMTTFDRQELTRKMRWLYVNAGLVRQMIADLCHYSVGDGISPQASSGNAVWDAAAEKCFSDWAKKTCEITGRYSFAEVQQIVCKMIDRDGEIFVLKTRGKDGTPKLQLIESHRVGVSNNVGGNPSGMFDGILFDKFGAVIGYNVIRSDGTGRLINSESMLHIHHPEQVSGARAYSPLQHSINNLIDILEILSLEKLAVKTSSDITRTITRESGQFDGSQSDFEAFGMRPQDYPQGVYNNPEQVGTFVGGKVLSLAPGEKLESFESQRPNQAFNGFIEHLQRDSTAGVLPYEFVADPTKAGGAAARLVVAKAERVFSARQQVLINRFLVPVWGYVIGNAIANGELAPNDNWHRVNWVTPRRVTVDAGREASANQKDIELGLKTLSDHFAENGMDAREEIRKRAADARFICDMAEQYDVPVSMIWKPSNTPNESIDSAINGKDGLAADGPETPLPEAGNP